MAALQMTLDDLVAPCIEGNLHVENRKEAKT
jgi:hypothetical protein